MSYSRRLRLRGCGMWTLRWATPLLEFVTETCNFVLVSIIYELGIKGHCFEPTLTSASSVHGWSLVGISYSEQAPFPGSADELERCACQRVSRLTETGRPRTLAAHRAIVQSKRKGQFTRTQWSHDCVPVWLTHHIDCAFVVEDGYTYGRARGQPIAEYAARTLRALGPRAPAAC